MPALVQALGDEPWLQYPAIHALGEIGDARATHALLALLDDELLRAAVIEALARVAGREERFCSAACRDRALAEVARAS